MKKNWIKVTSPLLPPLEKVMEDLQEIWAEEWITNNGSFHRRLEEALCRRLGVKGVSLFTNGTLPLITALQALGVKGEVITTPYSFVATSHSIWWNGLTPVFVDVDPIYGNIDPARIEEAITPRTTAIMPVHVYGNPCDTLAIADIARRHDLRVIYDAAHAFGVRKDGRSILEEGDISTLSFHATKTFTTAEGGAAVAGSVELKEKIDYLKNFGFAGETEVIMPGINSKMDEIRAAIGLRNLELVDDATRRRHALTDHYHLRLREAEGIRMLKDMEGVEHNYGYFPIFVGEDYPLSRDELYIRLKMADIFPRRYFYPLISDFAPYNALPSVRGGRLENARRLSEQVICLPMHHGLSEADLERVCSVILDPLRI